jgi:hypothetical protein
MGTTEVTVEQFRRFVKEAKYQTAGEVNKQGGMRVHKGKPTERMPEYIWSHPDFARGDNHPVTQVTWHDAIAFCAWLSKNEGRTYRLPTIPEWRWAERAGTDAGFYFGGASANFDAHAWHVGNSEMHSHAVGAKARNPWGLFDIYGNVWELSYDWQRNGKPVDLKLAKAGPGASDRILFLGGAFSALVDSALTPATGPPNIGYSHLGFRVVIVGDLKEKPPAAQTTTAQVFVIPANDKPNPKYAVAEFGGWRLEPGKPGEIRLFELPGLDVDDCWLIYRAKLKTDLLRNGVSLEMWGKRGEQEGGSTGNHQVAGITDWTTYETIFHVVKGRPVQNFTLGLRVHGDQPPNGRIWIKDVEVLLKQVAK